MTTTPPPPPPPPPLSDIPLPGVRLIGRPGQCSHLHWQVYSSVDVWPSDDARCLPPGSPAEEWDALRNVQKALAKERKEKGTQMYSHLIRNGNRPSLAAFDANMGPHSTLEAKVRAVLPNSTKPATHCFQLSLILPCTEHHTPACKTCPSPFTSSQRMRMAGSMSGYESLLLVNPSANVKAPFEGLWKFFTDAVVEQVARDEGWEGRRIAEGMLDRKPKHSLSCTPNAQLLLTIAPAHKACSPPSTTPSNLVAGTRCRLWPILQPAVFLQPVKIPPNIRDRLYDDFVEILAQPGWAGTNTGPRDVEWGGFWIPVSKLSTNAEEHLHIVDVRLNEQDEGRLTWWPLSLVKMLQDLKRSTEPIELQRPARACFRSTSEVATDTIQFIDGMLQLAQEEQKAERATQEENDSLAQRNPADGGSSVAMSRGDALSLLGEPLAEIDSRESKRSGGTDSDSDDLFESTPTPPPLARIPLPAEHDQNNNNNDAPIAKDSVDAVSSAVQSPVGFGTHNGSEYDHNAEILNTDAMAMVTEDDFDFFDAPAGAEENVMELEEKRDGNKMQVDEGMHHEVSFEHAEEQPQVLAMDWEEPSSIPVPREEAVGAALLEDDQSSDAAIDKGRKTDGGSPDVVLPAIESDVVDITCPVELSREVAPATQRPAPPAPTPVHALVPDIFSAIPFEERYGPSTRSKQRRSRFWPYGCCRPPIQAEISSRRWNPRQGLIDRLTAHEAIRQSRLGTKTYTEPKMTFTFESEMQDEGTMTDTMSDTSNEEEEMTDEGDDQGSVDALDPALAESVRPVDLLQDVTSAMSVREWLTASVQSVGKPSLSQLTRIRELLSEPTSSPEQVEAALIDSHKQPDWLWDWCTTGLVEMHGLGLQSWWTTWESDNGYYGDNECGVKEMVKISTLMEGSADKTENSLVYRQPLFHVTQSDSVISVAESALPYWLPLGLGPYGGRKAVQTFVLYDQDGVCLADVVDWQHRLAQAFEAHHLGNHILETNDKNSSIIGVAEDRWKEAIDPVIRLAIEDEIEIVIFAVVAPQDTPDRRLATSSGLINAYISSLKALVASFEDEEDAIRIISRRVVLQMIEECDIREPWTVGQQAIRMYDRLSRPVHRQAPRLLENSDTPRIISYIRAPAFRLAKPVGLPRVAPYFTARWPPPAIDVLETHRMMHVAYAFSRTGRSMYVFGIDELGETWDVKRMSVVGGKDGVRMAIDEIWRFAKRVMGRAAIEWRLAIVRLGSPSLVELQGWTRLFEGELARSPVSIHVLFFSYDYAPGSRSGSGSGSTSTSTSTSRSVPTITTGTVTVGQPSGCLVLPTRIAIKCPPDIVPSGSHGNVYPLITAILTTAPTLPCPPMALHHLLGLSTSMSTLKQSDVSFLKTVAQDYHDLRSLGIHRWGEPKDCPMPAHIAMVAMLSVSLSDLDNVQRGAKGVGREIVGMM